MKDDKAALTGEQPARVPEPGCEESLVGKNQEDILRGSRLRRMIQAGGGDPDTGKAARPGAAAEPVSDSRLMLIMQGKRAVKRFQWPGSEVEAGIVVLTAEEIEEAAIAASEHLSEAQKVLVPMAYMERLQHEESVQILWRAVLDVETGRPFALTPGELRRNLPTDVLSYLVGIYNDWQAQLSPLTHPSITPAEADRVIDAIKKNAKGISLDDYDAASLRHLLRRWASRPTDSPSSNS